MLDKVTLQASIRAAFVAEKDKQDGRELSIDEIARKIADAVDLYVRAAEVVGTCTVTTTGSPSAQSGGGSITGTLQ